MPDETSALLAGDDVEVLRSEADGCRRAERFCCEKISAGSERARRRKRTPGNKNRFLTQPPKLALKIKMATC